MAHFGLIGRDMLTDGVLTGGSLPGYNSKAYFNLRKRGLSNSYE